MRSVFNQIPWRFYTISDSPVFDKVNPIVKAYTFQSLFAIFMAQMKLTLKREEWNIRIKWVKAWEITGQSLSLACDDLVDNPQEYLYQVEAQPARNQWSRAGFRWPRSQQIISFPINSKIVCQVIPGILYETKIDPNLIMHFGIEVKPGAFSKPNSQFLPPGSSIVEDDCTPSSSFADLSLHDSNE